MLSWTFLIFFIESSSSRSTHVPRRSSGPLRYPRALLPRKISDENSHPKVIQEIHDLAGCPGEICGTLSGEAVTPLLAGAPECAQQDMADKIITIAKTQLQDQAVRDKLISLAKQYRQAERNTFPDYTVSSEPDRNSLYCQKAPKNAELAGLFQKQSSAADPKLFFDPKTNGKSVLKGSDPRTQPFGGATGQASATTPAKTDDGDADADVDEDGGADGGGDTDQESTAAGSSSGDGKEASSASSRDAAQIQRDRQLGITTPSSQASAASQNPDASKDASSQDASSQDDSSQGASSQDDSSQDDSSQDAAAQPAQPKKASSSKIKACRARRRMKF